MLALRYDPSIDPAGWWVSEKLDGVRASWDGKRAAFPQRAQAAGAGLVPRRVARRSRSTASSGSGRRRFDALSGLLRREDPEDPLWREVRYMLFDLPGAPGDFDTRLTHLRSLADAAGVPWVQAVPQQRVADRAALQRLLDEVLAGGGEGLMLHRADAHWQPGRSEALRKLTPWLDAEARVVGYLPGKGRLQGKVGALRVETADGRRFRIGSGLSDAHARQPARARRARHLPLPRAHPRRPAALSALPARAHAALSRTRRHGGGTPAARMFSAQPHGPAARYVGAPARRPP